jgi:hypothetical protein
MGERFIPFWLAFRRPSSLALYCNFLQHKVRRVFRSLAIGYAKSERMHVQTVQRNVFSFEE